ncbi:MAG: NrsF family protein, partial [Steroidobacteraceae bacterium]
VVVTALVVALASQLVYAQQVVGLRVGLQSASRHAAVAFGVVALMLGSTFLAAWRGRGGLGLGVTTLALTAASVPLMYAILVLLDPTRSFATTVEISPWGTRCMLIAALVGSFTLGAFVAALRRAAPVASRARGAALGAAAGAWAGFAVFVFCPSSDPQHLLVGHVLPVLAFTMLGALAVARALRP